jgi:hypothetical protein
MTGIYLRDLSEEVRKQFIYELSPEVRAKVLKAMSESNDVEIGQYYPHNKVKVMK